MRKIILFTVYLIVLQTSNAQNPDEFGLKDFENNVTPNSPTVSSLGTYGYAPINLATGLLNISVPIWSISGDGIQLDVNLTYRPGVKIAQTSEYSGHGWSLNAGGVITRSVMGEADPYPRLSLVDPLSYSQTVAIESREYDIAPDIFTFNFNGYTGQFALEDDFETLYFIGAQKNWKFSLENNQIEIIVEDGTKYIFRDIETTTIEREGGLYYEENVIVAWFLSEIISATSDEQIVFNYTSPNESSFPILKNNSLEVNPRTHQTIRVEQNFVSSDYEFSTKKIREIVYKKVDETINRIEFEANTPRYDLNEAGVALSKISIFESSDKLLKYFEFDIENVNNERIFLKSIQEFSSIGTASKPAQTFEYITPELLPGRLEYKADHWGYFSEHGTEFPYVPLFPWRQAKSKEPSNYAMYGSLSKITFPTGGYNFFEYELNEYYDQSTNSTKKGGGIRIKSQTISDGNTTYTKNFSYEIHNEQGVSSGKSSGQIGLEFKTHLLTPRGQLRTWVSTYLGSSLFSFCDLIDTENLGLSNKFAKFGNMVFSLSSHDQCYDQILITDMYTIKSKPYGIENASVSYTHVKEEEDGKGVTIHTFHGHSPSDRLQLNIDFTIFQGAQFDNSYGPDQGASYGWPFNAVFIKTPLLNKPAYTSFYETTQEGRNLKKKVVYDYFIDSNDLLRTGVLESTFSFSFVGISNLNYTYSLLKSKETITYEEDSSPVSEKTVYTYHPLNYHFFPTKITTSKSNGDAITKRIKYAQEYGNFDFSQGSSINISDLKAHNLHVPIEEQIWRKSTLESNSAELKAAKLYIYDKVSASANFFKPTKILTYENLDTYNSAYFSTEFNRAWHPKIDWYSDHSEIDYVPSLDLAYYDSGNLKQINHPEGTKTLYVWGYHQSQPIAKITGFTSINAAQQTAINNAIAAANNDINAATEATLRVKLQLLRALFASSNAQVTTYTYNPLVGITSITDPRGETLYYTYDAFHRLEKIKDAQGNILSKNLYHYKNNSQ